jgi:alkanesulfonate monooxygenase SsuD/methylene tetrahydromethanopterin reductase-like flavin-dependent oxidoreductase (luciferase family)
MGLIENCGLMLEPQENMSSKMVVEWAQLAERLGFASIFRSDHLLPTSGRRGIDSAECWVTLSALAAKTSKIKFGPLVSPVGFRNPALLAKMACTLSEYSDGRLILGVGAGWYKDEFDAYGIAFPPTSVRLSQLEEALRIIRPLTEGLRVDYDGKHFSAHVEFFPKPKSKIPLLVGGVNEKVVGVAAQFCDEWNFFMTNQLRFSHLKEVFVANRKGGQARISRMGPFVISESTQTLNEKILELAAQRGLSGDIDTLKKQFQSRGLIIGSPNEVREQIGRWIDLGVNGFMFQVLDPGDISTVELLADTLKANG